MASLKLGDGNDPMPRPCCVGRCDCNRRSYSVVAKVDQKKRTDAGTLQKKCCINYELREEKQSPMKGRRSKESVASVGVVGKVLIALEQ